MQEGGHQVDVGTVIVIQTQIEKDASETTGLTKIDIGVNVYFVLNVVCNER
jgi:hypothetical protein